MEDKLSDCKKHTKEISKQKVTFDRIISYLKTNEEITNHDEIQQILDKLISENRIEVMKLLNKLLCKPKDRVATEDKTISFMKLTVVTAKQFTLVNLNGL